MKKLKIDRYTVAFLCVACLVFAVQKGRTPVGYVAGAASLFGVIYALYLLFWGNARVIDSEYNGSFAWKSEKDSSITKTPAPYIHGSRCTPENLDGIKTDDCPLIFKTANGTDLWIGADGVVHNAGPGSWLVNTLRGAGNKRPEELPSDWDLLKNVKF